jgi:hypothetical protein
MAMSRSGGEEEKLLTSIDRKHKREKEKGTTNISTIIS